MQAPLRTLRIVNRPLLALLRSPARRLLRGSLVALTYPRPGDGPPRTIPVAAAAHGHGWVVLALGPERKRWWRAFRGGADAELLVDGTGVGVRGRLLDGAERRDALRAYVARFPRAEGRLALAEHPSDADLDAADAAVVLFRRAD